MKSVIVKEEERNLMKNKEIYRKETVIMSEKERKKESCVVYQVITDLKTFKFLKYLCSMIEEIFITL